MVPLTRRRLLHGTAALLAVTAGCGESTTDDRPTETESVPPGDSGAVPDNYALRNDTEEPPVRIPDADRRRTTTDRNSADPPDDANRHGLVASAETADRLWFADVDEADEARRFVADTDFDAETLYVEFRRVSECSTLELCSVSWSDTEIETRYGSTLRDADVSCQADAKDAVSHLIRIPEALDPDRIRSRGSSWRSSGCRRHRRPERSETTTEAPDFGPKSPNATETTAEDDR